MKNLRSRFARFCLRHRNKGIPNLMLFVVLGAGIVSLLCAVGNPQLYAMLVFDRDAILSGQVWRLITYPFTMGSSFSFFTLIALYCYYSLGRAIENTWGTFRFNLFYFSGVLLMDVFAMLFAGNSVSAIVDNIPTQYVIDSFYSASMTSFLNLSLLIGYATLYSESRFIIFFVIPIRARILGLLYLILILYEVISLSFPILCFPHNLLPLVGLANYFLFFGRDVINLLPVSWQLKLRRKPKKVHRTVDSGPIPFRPAQAKAAAKQDYNHRCTVCGRTDVTNPELEFRYCSRCQGYHCYCEDHISNHTHIE